MKLLLIEDPVNAAESLGAGLCELGYDVDLCVDGKDAIERAAGTEYDAIVLDLLLPRDASLMVLHEIRETNGEVDILILSTREQIRDRVTALIQGADDYLVKPVSCGELDARIRLLTGAGNGRSPGRRARAPGDSRSGHPDLRIPDLLQFCEAGEIELVISEVRLAALLERIAGSLEATARDRGVSLVLPAARLPTLLVDGKWMEQLLVNLIFGAITRSRAGSRVELKVSCNCEYCRIDIECSDAPACDLTSIKRFARHLNLEVLGGEPEMDPYRVGIARIRIV
jgi:DNA-binding response OmpR family regulator